MTEREMERFKQYMHHHVVVHKSDGSTVEGHIQPWGGDTIYVTPMGEATGEAVRVRIADIDRVDLPDD